MSGLDITQSGQGEGEGGKNPSDGDRTYQQSLPDFPEPEPDEPFTPVTGFNPHYRAGHDMPEAGPVLLPGGFDAGKRTRGRYDQADDLGYILVPVRTGKNRHAFTSIVLRPTVAALAMMLEGKIRQFDGGPGWETLSVDSLVECLQQDYGLLSRLTVDREGKWRERALDLISGIMAIIDKSGGLDYILAYLREGDI